MENKSPKYIRKAATSNKANKSAPKVVDLIKPDGEYNDEQPKGNPTGICKLCGKTFDQDYYPDGNRYSSYKTCHACRKKISEKKEKRIKEEQISTVTLPFNPHPWQAQAFEDFKTHRFNLWACGARSGKDFSANMIGIWYFVQCLNENRAINHPEMSPSVLWWIVAPTEPMAKQNWRDLKKQFPKEWIVATSESSMTMQTVGGGIIEVRSAYNPESLVGVGLDLVTITEAARIKDLDIVWSNLEARLSSPGRGLEADRKGKRYGQGKCIINSTPIGKNYFYEMWKWGQKDSDSYSSDWVSYQLPWTCNPANEELAQTIVHTKFGDMTREQDMRRRLGERRYRQDFLADFLASDGSVFKQFDDCVENLVAQALPKQKKLDRIKEWQMPMASHQYRIGYDPATGSSTDSPAVVVRDMTDNRIVRAYDLYGFNYDQQWDKIAEISRMYNYAPCVWLRTGHTAVENQLAKRGVVEMPIDEQAGKKAVYIQSLELAVQNKDVRVLNDGSQEIQTLIMQMNDYTEHNGRYSNEIEEHDDFVSACYAVYHDYSFGECKASYCPLMGAIKRNA
jgi:hypothetical protein